jgi:hypothetical protein
VSIPETFDRTRFASVSDADLAAEREALRQELEQQELASPAREDSGPIEAEPLAARMQLIDQSLAVARAELESRLDFISERVRTRQIERADFAGLGDLWTLARDQGLADSLREAVSRAAPEPAVVAESAVPPVDAARLEREIAERDAELTVRLAERQMRTAGTELDPILAQSLADQVLARAGHSDTAASSHVDQPATKR